MTRSRIEMALGILLGLAFAALLIALVNGCTLDRDAPSPGHFAIKAQQCGCYASLVVTEDGGICERPGATCPRVCTCVQSTMRLCYAPPRSDGDFTGYVCAADDGDAG